MIRLNQYKPRNIRILITYKKSKLNQTLYVFHLHTCSLNKNFHDLEYLIKTTNEPFDVFAISECRVKSNMDNATNINLPNYSIEYTPTESHARGTLLYSSNDIAYKQRQVLNIYKSHELESTYTEIINLKKLNIIIVVVYRYSITDLNEFNYEYVNKFLDNIAKE